MGRPRLIQAIKRLFTVRSSPPAGFDWPTRTLGALGVLVSIVAIIELVVNYYRGVHPLLTMQVYIARAIIVLALGIWIMWRNPWRQVDQVGMRLARMMFLVNAAVMIPSFAFIIMADNRLQVIWDWLATMVSVIYVFWLARRGYPRFAGAVLIVKLIIAVLGISAMFGAPETPATLLIYGAIVLVGGLMVRWWTALVLAVVMPLLVTGLVGMGLPGYVIDWQTTISQVLILMTQAGVAGLYSYTLERSLFVADERAEELQRSQTALVDALDQLERSERQLKTIITHNPVILFTLDRHGVFTLAKGEELNKMGIDETRLVGRSAMQLFQYTSLGPDIVERALKGEQVHGQMRIQDLVFDVFISPVTGEDGAIQSYIGIATDITERIQAEEALRRSEQNYRSIFNATSEAIFIHDAVTGKVLDVNERMLEMYGCTYEEALQLQISDFDARFGQSPQSNESALEKIHQAVELGPQVFQWRSRRANGAFFWSEISLSCEEIGGEQRVLAVLRDISERKQMEEALYEEKERAMVTLHSIGDAVITTDAAMHVVFLNPVAENLTGWTQQEAHGRPLSEVFHIIDEFTLTPARNPVEICLSEGRIVSLPTHTILIHRDGTQFDVDDSAAPIRSRDGQIMGAVLVFHDVSEARRLTRQMAYDATHDLLTGLINRREFEIRLERALESAKEAGEQHALCYLDLDQFKIINDTAGHAVGAEMLKEITRLLNGLFRRNDTLARLGGDEFGLLLLNCPVDVAVIIANSVIERLAAYRFHWQGRTFQIGVSIGVSAITAESASIAQVLSQADVACYTAKDLGRGRVHIFHPEDVETTQRHSELMQVVNLRESIERERFLLYCQPIVPLDTGHGARGHYEILLRMQDEEGRLVLPHTFIGPAERFDLMGSIDRWVIQKSFSTYSQMFNGKGPSFAINLSGNSLNDDSLLDYVFDQLQAYKIPPERLCFEITEPAAIHNLNKAGEFAREIRRQGIRIALDDFGSGLSSFRYLKTLPVDFLKIDGSFVQEILDSVTDLAMVAAINQVGHSLGIQTIAEHVTSPEIAQRLRELGVDYAQGYGLGRPTPVSEAWQRPE